MLYPGRDSKSTHLFDALDIGNAGSAELRPSPAARTLPSLDRVIRTGPMVFNLVFDTAEFVNILLGMVGQETLARFIDRVIKNNGSMRHLAKRIERGSDGLVVDRRAFVKLISDVATWEALAMGDPMRFEPFAQQLATTVDRGSGKAEYHANCVKVAKVMANELLSTLTAVEQLQLKTYVNTSALLGDLNDFIVSLDEKLVSLNGRLDTTLESLLPTQFTGLAGMNAGLAVTVDRVVAAMVQTHREASQLAGEHDRWQIRDMDRTVLKQMLGDMSRLFEPPPLPGERLLLHVIPLYVDAVLRLEAAERKEALAGTEPTPSGVIRADLVRVRGALPSIAKRVDSDRNSPLTDWLAHQATLRSPSVWESWTAYRLAAAIADLLEERPPRRGAVATLIRRLGRNAAYDTEYFEPEPWAIRLPSCTESLTISPSRTATITRFVWQAIIDPRRAGMRIAEHVGMTGEFALSDALDDVHSAQWDVDGNRLELDAWCSHPAVALALIGHAAQVDRELDDLRREHALPVPRELRVGSARVRPRLQANGRPLFELPLIQLQLSQEETRQLLMGTALYGRPELAIREMYQNSLDACRYRAFRREYLHRTRPGSVPEYLPRIDFRQQPTPDGGSLIECRDNGVGMSYIELRDAFAQAGRRFTDLASFQDEQARWTAEDADLRLYPNSRFGIGVFSYFMLADEVEVTTVRQHPDGSLGPALHVHISALSGLLTVSKLEDRPSHIADGGTVIRLVVPAASVPGSETVHVSVSDLLEDLIWYSDAELIVREMDRPVLEWRPGEISGPAAVTTMLAFHKDECRGWWTQGRGGVLSDGIRTGVDLPGMIVDLRGPHAPVLRADRNEVLDWDRRWVVEQFVAAADGVVDWPDVDLEWLWRVALVLPRIGHAIYGALASRGSPIPIGTGRKPDATMDPRVVGCLPADPGVLGGRRDDSPFPSPPEVLASDTESLRRPPAVWPENLLRYRRSLWRGLLGVGSVVRESPTVNHLALDTVSPICADGFPVPSALESALLCGINRDRFAPFAALGAWYARADVPALVAGTSRAAMTLAEAVRNIRRFHVAGVVLPDVDARELYSPQLAGEVTERVVSGSWALTSFDGRPSPAAWVAAAIATARQARRPLKTVWAVFSAMDRLGYRALPPLPPSLADRVPTLNEVEILAVRYGGLSLSSLLSRAAKRGVRRTDDLVRLLLPYEALLRDTGVDLDVLRRLAAHEPDDDERIAWSREADGHPPWLYGEHISETHLVRVAHRLGITLAAAWELAERCPGAQLKRRKAPPPNVGVEELDVAIVRAWYDQRGGVGQNVNAVQVARWAREHGFEPEDVANRMRRLQTSGFPAYEVDWSIVDGFSFTYLQRELVMRRTPAAHREHEPVATAIGPGRLVQCSAKLRVSMSELTEAATALSAVGVTCSFPPVASPVEQPTEADVRLVMGLLNQTKAHLASAIAAHTAQASERVEPRLDQVRNWMRWLWWDDQDVQQVIAAADQLREPLREGPFDEIVPEVLYRLEQIVASPEHQIHRAHLIELAGSLGVPLTRLREALEPFDRVMASLGWQVPWFGDPTDVPPEWLDVAVVGLIVAYGEAPDWTADLADFLSGNIDAAAEEIRICWDRWAGLVHADPHGLPSASFQGESSCTGMVQWTKTPRRA